MTACPTSSQKERAINRTRTEPQPITLTRTISTRSRRLAMGMQPGRAIEQGTVARLMAKAAMKEWHTAAWITWG